MTLSATQSTRVVHLDPNGFGGDTSVERKIFADAFDHVIFEAIDTDDVASIGRADVLLTHYTVIDAAAMQAVAPQVIVRYATGVDGIDLEAATRLGVRVIRIPEYCDAEVAEHVMAMAFALWRRLPQYAAHTAAGGWQWRHANPDRLLGDATFGLLGFGHKAQAVAPRARALGCRVLAFDPAVDAVAITALGVEAVTFDALLKAADVLSLHVPLTESTDGLLDAAAFASMPQGSILINTARGRLLDERALRDALDSGHLAGAGLDVLSVEPPPLDHPLLGRDDVIVTPHAAWYSRRAEQRCRQLGSEYAVAALRRQTSDGLVNPASLEVATARARTGA